ncbi:hypothetical protein Brsp06_03484 [Brucella sp. NBRC 13694]|uniref:hypothetical protein n=1 Tax=Brucella sp. NBRC 13694 TaxID=3075482 RepID=UPI0030A0D0CA
MSHTFIVPFEWEGYWDEAVAQIMSGNYEQRGELALQLIDKAVREEYPELPSIKFDIDGTDSKHIIISLDDDTEAMLFKLTHDGE